VALFAIAIADPLAAQTYKVGDRGPGGGIIFYYNAQGFTVQAGQGFAAYTAHYLEVAPSDQSASAQWGGRGTTVPNVTNYTQPTDSLARAIGNGRRDTALIVSQLGTGETGRAAQLAAAFRGGGQSDWFLPSIGELFALYQSGVSGMTSGVYWSSSQQNANGWRLSFSGNVNTPLTAAKTVESRVRAIRAFAESSAAAVNTSLDGVWANESGSIVITVSGNAGVITTYNPTSARSIDAVNKGFVKVGDQYWRNLRSTGNLTWSGQGHMLTFNTSSPDVATGTSWGNTTFTMSADGRTLTAMDTTWTKR
jgi:hypothetical protein